MRLRLPTVMKLLVVCLVWTGLIAAPVAAQDTAPPPERESTTSAAEPPDQSLLRRNVFDHLAGDVLRDQKDLWTFPRHLGGKRWLAAAALAGAVAAAVAADPRDTPYFRQTSAFRGFNQLASGLNTSVAMATIPAAFYLTRAAADDDYGKQTAFDVAEAVADVQILTFAAKTIDRRLRPSDVAPRGDFANTWFEAPLLGGKSFPSGHTITAFAIAQVFAERYRDHRWVPWVAYGLAGTVGFSRVTLQAHFPSDVLAGAALGIVMTHSLVLHR